MTDDERLASIRWTIEHQMEGIERTEAVFPFGAFLLALALLEALGNLAMPPVGSKLDRFARFVRDYMPPDYAADELPRRLYDEGRGAALHRLGLGPSLAIVDGQDTAHLVVASNGMTVLRVDRFIADVRGAVSRLIARIDVNDSARRELLANDARRPHNAFTVSPVSVQPGSIATAMTTQTTTNVVLFSQGQHGPPKRS